MASNREDGLGNMKYIKHPSFGYVTPEEVEMLRNMPPPQLNYEMTRIQKLAAARKKQMEKRK